MANKRKIDFVIPGLLWPAGIQDLESESNFPMFLRRLLTRSNVDKAQGESFSETLFEAFGISKDLNEDLPEGAVSLSGQGGEPANACWAIATPVYLLADRDRVILLRLNRNGVSEHRAGIFLDMFNEHFKDVGLSLIKKTNLEWYLKLEDCPKVKTYSIEAVAGRNIFEYLPDGQDGNYWRSIFNEVQMLFFQSAIEDKSDIAVSKHINALWINGFGKIPEVSTKYAAIYSDHPLSVGLAKLSNTKHKQLPSNLQDVYMDEGDILIVLTNLHGPELDADKRLWKRGVTDIDEIVRSLFSIDCSKSYIYSIYPCAGKRLSVTKGIYRRRFWRNARKLTSIL